MLGEGPGARRAGCLGGEAPAPCALHQRVGQFGLRPFGRMQHAGETDESRVRRPLEREQAVAAQRPLPQCELHGRPCFVSRAQVVAAIAAHLGISLHGGKRIQVGGTEGAERQPIGAKRWYLECGAMRPSMARSCPPPPVHCLHSMHCCACPRRGLLLERFGRTATTAALRAELAARRKARAFPAQAADILDAAADALARQFATSQRPVFNMTGTVLHTNLGRAPLPPVAAAAAAEALACGHVP